MRFFLATALFAAVVLSSVGGAGAARPAGDVRVSESDDPVQARQALSRKNKRRVKRAFRLYRNGKPRRARRVLRKVKRASIPLRRTDRLNKVALRGSGCGIASGTASWEVDFIGTDVFKASLSQYYCWKKGKVVSYREPQVTGDITGFGEIINFSYEGVIASEGHWDRWEGHRHGARFTVRAMRFHACTPIPTGCIFPVDHDVAVALHLRGNGTFGFGQS